MFKLSEKDACVGKRWGNKEYNILKKIDNNTNTPTNNHHNSIGAYYSFGHEIFYGKVGSSSINQCTIKKFTKIDTKNLTMEMEKLFSTEIKFGIDNLAQDIPDIGNFIAPILDIGYKLQENHGTINFKKGLLSDNGIWKKTVAVNSGTVDLYQK